MDMEDPAARFGPGAVASPIHAHSASVKCVSGGRRPAARRRVRTDEGRLGDDRGRVRDRGDADGAARDGRLDEHELQRIQVRRHVRRSHRRGARGRACRPRAGRDATASSSSSSSGIPRTAPSCSPRRDPTTAPRGCGTHRDPRPRPPPRERTATTSCACPSAPTPARWSREAPTGRYASGRADDAAAGPPCPAPPSPGSNARLDPPSVVTAAVGGRDRRRDVLSADGGRRTPRVFSHASNGGAVCEVVFAGHGGARDHGALQLPRRGTAGWGSPPRGRGRRRVPGRVVSGSPRARRGRPVGARRGVNLRAPDGDGNVPRLTSAKVRGRLSSRVHAKRRRARDSAAPPRRPTVASASEDRTVRLWNMQKQPASACWRRRPRVRVLLGAGRPARRPRGWPRVGVPRRQPRR